MELILLKEINSIGPLLLLSFKDDNGFVLQQVKASWDLHDKFLGLIVWTITYV